MEPMEEEIFEFQQPLLVGVGASAASMDDDYFSGNYAGLSFRSMLAGGSFDPAAETRDPLRTPKIEPPFPNNGGASVGVPLYNFFSEAALFSSSHQLPRFLSFEQPQDSTAAAHSSAPNHRSRADLHGKPQRKRRIPFRLSDKTRCLWKLLPGEGKMDMAAVLEEAYKYIKFLQAQVSALESMPFQIIESDGGGGASNIVGGDLGRLNRQQLLQVVLNSPKAQAQICAQGCCVYSAEQVFLVERIAEREALIQNMMMYGSSNSNNFGA